MYIFVSAADCDSCCAFRIFKTLLESDNITFVVFAVAGFDDLQKRGEQMPRDGKVRRHPPAPQACRLDVCVPFLCAGPLRTALCTGWQGGWAV